MLKPGIGEGASGSALHLLQTGDPPERPITSPDRPSAGAKQQDKSGACGLLPLSPDRRTQSNAEIRR